MGTLTLTRVGTVINQEIEGGFWSNNPSHQVARRIACDYVIGTNPVFFEGWTENGEYVAHFVQADGSAYSYITGRPDDYCKLSKLFDSDANPAKIPPELYSSAPEEYEMDPGTFVQSAETIEIKTKQTWY